MSVINFQFVLQSHLFDHFNWYAPVSWHGRNVLLNPINYDADFSQSSSELSKTTTGCYLRKKNWYAFLNSDIIIAVWYQHTIKSPLSELCCVFRSIFNLVTMIGLCFLLFILILCLLVMISWSILCISLFSDTVCNSLVMHQAAVLPCWCETPFSGWLWQNKLLRWSKVSG